MNDLGYSGKTLFTKMSSGQFSPMSHNLPPPVLYEYVHHLMECKKSEG